MNKSTSPAASAAPREYVDRELSHQREYLLDKIKHQGEFLLDKITNQRDAAVTIMTAEAIAREKAAQSVDTRISLLQGFRDDLTKIVNSLMTRHELELILTPIRAKLDELEKVSDTTVAESQGVKGGWGYAAGALGLLLTVGMLVALLLAAFRV